MTKVTKFRIEDWAGNVFSYDKVFKRPQLAVPMEFDSWDDAEEYICELLGDDYENSRGELYIEEIV